MPTFRFAVVRTRRWGRKIPDRELRREAPVVGDLEIFTLVDPHLHRPVRIAKLTSTVDAQRPELVPSLYDAEVIALGGTGATIIGVERLCSEEELVEVAQSWWARIV